MEPSADELTLLVGAAIENKYGNVSQLEVQALVERALDAIGSEGTEIGLKRLCGSPKDVVTDVKNQVVGIVMIERIWRRSVPKRSMVEEIHSVVLGASQSLIRYRDSMFVLDFGGQVATPVAEIPVRLEKLNRILTQKMDSYYTRTLTAQAEFLARLFAELIRIHPFEDGNGRTARMLVLYCLRRWGRPYIVIPKVRNEPNWKSALIMSMKGQEAELARLLADMLKYRVELGFVDR